MNNNLQGKLNWLLKQKLAYQACHYEDSYKYIVCLDNKAFQSHTGIPITNILSYYTPHFKVHNFTDLVLYIPSHTEHLIICADSGPTRNLIYIADQLPEINGLDDLNMKAVEYTYIKRAFEDAKSQHDPKQCLKDAIVSSVLDFLNHYKQYVKEKIRTKYSQKDIVFYVPLIEFASPVVMNQCITNASKDVSQIVGMNLQLSYDSEKQLIIIEMCSPPQ